MKKKNGFTLIELMIVLSIVGILVAMIVPVITGKTSAGPLPDHKCIAGYAFTFGGVQILSENGKGIPCAMQSNTPKVN
jgi:prepilin-type N-terminal cleavage/methylation domain-containing protein